MNEKLEQLRASGIRAFSALAKQTPGCIDLTIGEPDLSTPRPIREAAKAALDRHRTHYAPNIGTPSLRRAIAAAESARGLDCREEQVLVTMGATGAIHAALTSILNPGDEVLILQPAFALYESVTLLAGAKPVFVDLEQTGFQVTAGALEQARTERTRAIVVNSPCNPTGTVLNSASVEVIAAFAQRYGIYVLCDNVYMSLCQSGAPDLSLRLADSDRLLYCQSFSKSHAMTGWRIGYLIAPEALIQKAVLLQAAGISCVPTFVQDAAETALQTDNTDIREIFRFRRIYLENRLRDMGLSLPFPRGGFYAFPSIRHTGMDGDTFCRRLIREAGVASVPGEIFGTPGYIRLSACRSEPELKEAMDRMERFLKNL